MTDWLLLHYKLPNKPTALRVYIWRKLKRIGAVLLHESVWVLPDLPRTAEQIQWLTAEIQEMGGEAHSWRATTLLGEKDDAIKEQFTEQIEAAYSELLKKIKMSKPDLQDIARQYQQIATQDFFHSKLGREVRHKLTLKRGEKP
jgi:DNA-binding transcriptional regulator PaaX